MTRVPRGSLSKLGCVALTFTAVTCVSTLGHAAPKQGDFLQTDSLSMTLWSHDFTTDTSTSVANTVNLSGLVGIHYYFVDRVRLGVSMQATARLWPEPEPGSSRAQRFAFLPQIGWNFWDPLFGALLFAYAPRTRGKAIPDMSLAVLLGVGVPLSDSVRLSLSVEVPWAFYYHQTLSLAAVTGLSVRF